VSPRGGTSELLARFAREVDAAGIRASSAPLVVAVSGGMDSMVLLHLLRFGGYLEPSRIVVASFDHGMRPESASDVSWVRGVARAWGVDFRGARADGLPSGEEGARVARHRFLREVRNAVGAEWIATGHHADDQAETVLFRVLRGTGIRGLAGMSTLGSGLWRPLLDMWEEELARYARERGVGWRDDPTNRDLRYSRNAIRHVLIPAAEARVHPGARRALIRLAETARADESAWISLLPGLLAPLDVTEGEAGISFLRERMLAYHPAVQARLARHLAARAGLSLGSVGTRRVVEFTSSGQSGHAVSLASGAECRREFDRIVMGAAVGAGEDTVLVVEGTTVGEGKVVLGGRAYRVSWGTPAALEARWGLRLDPETVSFPLRIRSWVPGDRIRTHGGTRKLKKCFLEARLPPGERHRVPVVTDAGGRVLWVPGVAEAAGVAPPTDRQSFRIGLDHA